MYIFCFNLNIKINSFSLTYIYSHMIYDRSYIHTKLWIGILFLIYENPTYHQEIWCSSLSQSLLVDNLYPYLRFCGKKIFKLEDSNGVVCVYKILVFFFLEGTKSSYEKIFFFVHWIFFGTKLKAGWNNMWDIHFISYLINTSFL